MSAQAQDATGGKPGGADSKAANGGSSEQSSLNSFLFIALTNLRKASGRKHKDLRAALDAQIAAVQESERKVRSDPDVKPPSDADPAFYCFKLACDTAR
jgi:hypothetical protein